MIESCVHTHTTFCDGKNTVSEMARHAFECGVKTIGFSSHSYDPLDDFGVKSVDMDAYRSEVRRVGEMYEGRMDVLCGLELDSFASPDLDVSGLDYVIGSAHEVRGDDGSQYIIDGAPDRMKQAAERCFGGSFRRLCAAYYAQFADFIRRRKPDIVGHFDLIAKYNQKHGFFDEDAAEYKNAALAALDAVLESGSVIELNTGAMARGHRTTPFPARFLLERILQKKRSVIITTDAHRVENLLFWAAEAEEYLSGIGFKSVLELGKDGFYERALR